MKTPGEVVLMFTWVSGIWFSRISGAEEVEMKVSLGDDVTLYSDCVIPAGLYIAWFRNCSHQHQPPLVITHSEIFKNKFPRFTFVKNSSGGAYDLLVRNVTENDLGLYYCATHERKISADGKGARTVYRYGNLTWRLSYRETVSSCLNSTPAVPDCWKLLVSVCPVCVVLSSLISSTCVYCICRTRTKDLVADARGGLEEIKRDEVGRGEVWYASLDLPSRGQKHLRKKKKRRVKSSDFSTYSEVQITHLENSGC